MFVIGENGGHCGRLELSYEEQKNHFGFHEDNNLVVSRTVECVAICERKKPSAKGWKYIEENPQFEEEYGVLWIEWVDGVAYRKSAGYIDKKSWESHDLEDIHLVLG